MFVGLLGIITSGALVGFGLAVAFDYRRIAARVVSLIAGAQDQNPARPQPSTDRFWALLPLSLGIGFPAVVLLKGQYSFAASVASASAAAVYYIAMMRLGWLYTPPKRRILGPLFWTRRATAIPLVAFFVSSGAFW